ncbi:helix-turn-helix transcriptional regulator [Acetivibrio cellulolyticus]|uniref:helix-turn-helix transcriptional regulator n=1 Tax=Acetivibrio cellulolyticus TaxID=35830 RepID=UPI0001E2D96C|nr:helix-turn-helix transcriptional regulator [Acetivibrio cellulolyticus]
MRTIIAKPDNIIQARLKKCLSMRTLSKEADVDVATIHRIETCKTKSVSVSTAGKICKALEIDFDEIFQIIEG